MASSTRQLCPSSVRAASGASRGTDIHCRVVARTNEHLQDVINRMLHVQGITRTTSVIVLSHQIPYRVLPLVAVAATSLRRDEVPTTLEA